MKNNQNRKGTKNDTLPPARVGEETKKKFLSMCEEADKSQSAMLRELIDNGKVEVMHNGKELIKDVAEMRRKINQYNLKITNDIQAVKEDIQQLYLCMHNQGDGNEMLGLYLAKASLRLDDIKERSYQQLTICTRVFPGRSDNYGNL